MNNISIGQYVKGDSYLHKMDPRFKILATIFLMVAIFLIPSDSYLSMYILGGFTLFLLFIMITSKVSLMRILKGLQPILFIGLFTFVLQILYNNPNTANPDIPIAPLTILTMNFSWLTILAGVMVLVVWFLTSKYMPLKMLYMVLMFVLAYFVFVWIKVENAYIPVFGHWSLEVYKVGLLKGAFFFLRIVLVIMISTLLTMTTSTNDINLGLEWVLHPLTYIKIPVGEFAMLLSLTLRFIPTLMIETDKIMKAQASRGIDFNEGSLMEKVRQIVTLLIPMFVISINRAEDLANAMEARGYIVGDKRTNIEVLKFSFKDYFGFFVVLAIFAGSIVLKVIL